MADKSQNQPGGQRRGAGRPFPKGQSGNPGGRPKGIGHVREAAQMETEACIRRLVELRDQSKNLAVSRAAAVDLLDRGWGRPQQPLDHTGDAGPLQIFIHKEDPEQADLEAQVADLRAGIEAAQEQLDAYGAGKLAVPRGWSKERAGYLQNVINARSKRDVEQAFAHGVQGIPDGK